MRVMNIQINSMKARHPKQINNIIQFFFCQTANKFKTFTNPRLKRIKEHDTKRPKEDEDDQKLSEKRILKEKEQNLLKEYETFKRMKEQTLTDIPPNLVIKNLHYPATGTDVILLGVEKRNTMHASFIHDCMVNLKPGMVTTQIAPDMPYFIRTKIKYEEAWNRFVKGKFDYKFYVNPQPTSVYDIMLNSESINQLVSGGIQNSQDKFEFGSLFVYTPSHVSQQFEVDAFLTPLIYLYNNPHVQCNLIFNDYPFLKFRDNVNRLISPSDLKELYAQCRQVLEEQGTKTMFDPMLLKPELFIYPKVAYITEAIRNSCYASKKVLAIVDRHASDEIEDYWRTRMSPKPMNLSVFLKDEFFLKSLLKNPTMNKDSQPFITEEGIKGFAPEERESYLEYIEKHVLLDLMIEPLIKDYFIKNKVFPYSGKGYIGHKTMIQQIFVILDHFYHQHQKQLKDVEAASFDERLMHGAPNDFKEKKPMQ